jgi:capsular polysaccharide biosynthesis protein
MPSLKSKLRTFLLASNPDLQKYLSACTRVYEQLFLPFRYLPGNSAVWGPPRGMYHSAAEYNKRNPTTPIIELTLKEPTNNTYRLPWSNSEIVTSFFKENINTELIEKKAWFLKNARYLSGHNGTIITSDDKIFLPLSPPEFYRTYKNQQSFYYLKLPKMARLKKVILMDTLKAETNNHYHWLCDHISRFFWLRRLNIDLSEYTLVATNGSADFCRQTREVLMNSGFNFKEWLFTHDFPHFYADEIIVPPYVNFQLLYGFLDMDEINFLREVWLKPGKPAIDVYDKIYLSRRKTGKRYTPAHTELTNRLAEYGVKEVFLENMTVFEQAATLNNATLIIGIHGAAFTNIVFCKPGATVIEIFGADHLFASFWSITETLNLNYYAYCDDEFKASSTPKVNYLAPTYINVDNFFACFTKLNLL